MNTTAFFYDSGTTRQAVVSSPGAPVAVNARYTLDGTTPSRTVGTLITTFPTNVPISGGYRELRAIAFAVDPKSGYEDSQVTLTTFDWTTTPAIDG